MADEHGNIRFDEACHRLFAVELREAEVIAKTLVDMFAKCYAESDGGAADRARRGLRAARRALLEVQIAMAALSVAETGSTGSYRPYKDERPVRPAPDAGRGVYWCTCPMTFGPDDKVTSERDPNCAKHGGPPFTAQEEAKVEWPYGVPGCRCRRVDGVWQPDGCLINHGEPT